MLLGTPLSHQAVPSLPYHLVPPAQRLCVPRFPLPREACKGSLGDVLNSLVCIILLSRVESSAIPYCVHMRFEDVERVTRAGTVALLTTFLFWPYITLMLVTRLSTILASYLSTLSPSPAFSSPLSYMDKVHPLEIAHLLGSNANVPWELVPSL